MGGFGSDAAEGAIEENPLRPPVEWKQRGVEA